MVMLEKFEKYIQSVNSSRRMKKMLPFDVARTKNSFLVEEQINVFCARQVQIIRLGTRIFRGKDWYFSHEILSRGNRLHCDLEYRPETRLKTSY